MLLYLHIPFCVRKCLYCDFVSFSGEEKRIADYVDALLREMDARPAKETVNGVFLGGGTPSLLPPEDLKRLFEGIRAHYRLGEHCEITSECNPGTVTEAWLDAAAEAGINRLSVGVQAVQPELLRRIGRIHDFVQAQETFARARKAGITNLSADLMYALPGQTLLDWEESLRSVLELAPEHLSCYALTVAEDTPFGRLEQEGKLPRPDEDTELAMQALTRELLEKNGLFQYEVSNYAKPGRASRHNLGYWIREDYIGLGCAAHSLQKDVRMENTPSLENYLQGTDLVVSRESISAVDRAFEEVMLGLRLVSGITLSKEAKCLFLSRLKEYETMGLAQLKEDHICLTRRGFDVMNTLLSDLMPEE